ncbi:hypothetical protein [Spirosoma sp. KUDC1026]|uniref:hypothetical protein n=1 Tax=Spirosoma sp. KUDC1026 TaxID=2745947 RepID=UPI001E4D6E0E|nr:hypothetical protein [Spirosoma sp. KUDC1026]
MPKPLPVLLTTDALIDRISRLQQPDGLFASYRSNAALFYRRPDTNIFFTVITVFTLQRLRDSVSPAAQQQIDLIAERAERAYERFQNKDGLKTYNFWPTRPSQHFSNGYLFRHFEHFRIPDDIDDTAMVYLTTETTSTERLWLKEKLSQHTNGSQPPRLIQNTYSDYQQLRAYSTWFGKNMPVDFDACALSNLLYWVYQDNLPRNQHDTDALTYLRSIVETGRYVTEPFQCAPHYARTSLIIYHLARLLSAFSIPELEVTRPRLVADSYEQLNRATNQLERVLLTTALHWLGERPFLVDLDNIEQAFDTFHFFIAGMLTAYEQPWLRRFADRPWVQMRWQCEAHNWALVTEYLVLVTGSVKKE